VPDTPSAPVPPPPLCIKCGSPDVHVLIAAKFVIHWYCPNCGQIWGTPINTPKST